MLLKIAFPKIRINKICIHVELNNRLEKLEGLTKLHLNLCNQMMKADSGKFYPLDLLAAATIKRSMALIQGFITLVRKKNYSCAASLLRLQLDSCLRLFAAFIVAKPHDLANDVLKGKSIRKMKDRDGALMTDAYLVQTLASKYEWIPRVYKETSGFIHLSEKHIFSIIDKAKSDHDIGFRIAADDKDIPLELWIELIDGFMATTSALFDYLKGWVFTKEHPEVVAKIRENKNCQH